jgi:drug/metabolite transporter (DMT)-like permease
MTALFWGANAVMSRLAIGEISPLMLVFLRWMLALALLWPIYGREVVEHWPVIRPKLLAVTLMAALGFTGFNVLFYMAAYQTTAINIGILQGSIPVLVLAGSFLVHGTRATALQIIGVLITVLGVVLIATRGAPEKLLDLDINRGDALVLIACALYAFYTVALKNRPAMPGAPFFTLLALISALTTLPLIAFEAWHTGLQWPTPKGWAITLFVAVFPSCLAQLFFMRGVDAIGPGRAGVYVNLVPVFAAGLGIALLGETFAVYHVLALTFVIGGIAIAQHAGSRRS